MSQLHGLTKSLFQILNSKTARRPAASPVKDKLMLITGINKPSENGYTLKLDLFCSGDATAIYSRLDKNKQIKEFFTGKKWIVDLFSHIANSSQTKAFVMSIRQLIAHHANI